MIVHISSKTAFISPYIHFVRENFNIENHQFLINTNKGELNETQSEPSVIYFQLSDNKKYFRFSKKVKPYLKKADKVILHGLFIPNLVFLLFLNKALLKKCYWMVYGDDLYYYKYNNKRIWSKFFEQIRKRVIKNVKGLITHIEHDYYYAKSLYNVKGSFLYCLMYPSNLFKDYNLIQSSTDKIIIQIGNSGDSTNNHIDILEKLSAKKNENIQIICPLSYGKNKKYIEKVVNYGNLLFSKKFIPLLDHLPLDEYISVLSKVDIALFNHDRQQGLGNIITLLGLGKKVYLRDNITTWNSLTKLNLQVFSINNEEFNLNLLSQAEKDKNISIIKNNYSKDNLKQQLETIFNHS